MYQSDWITPESRKSLGRLLPRIEALFRNEIRDDADGWGQFKARLDREWPRLFGYLHFLYGWQYDFFYTLEQIVVLLAQYWLDRPADLKQLDAAREADPDWFLSQEMVGGVLYVDLFSDNLAKLKEHIPYFRELGLTYLHLMPLFAVPHGDNDGGYAVSDYRAVNPDIGTMEELNDVARVLRREGISLALDFVFNHTSEDHIWAKSAKAGNAAFQAYYHTFPDREVPDRYQPYLRDIFPSVRRGSFTYDPEMGRWVWTTFNSFQWDLNYTNPEVFQAMAGEMLFLANQGVEILRLDAVAFIWKRVGTDCENQPEAHIIIRAFNAMARIAAPAMLFKSEAIVHPDEVVRYIDREECQLSYNPLLMALIWEALATREVRFLSHAMRYRSRIADGCSWVNYLRCHDDIGWTFDDDDARFLGIDPKGHRDFLNRFYTGNFPGTFATGIPFQYNPETGDLRISGTLASLAGLEQALEKKDDALIELAVRRINMLRSIMLSVGGIPLIYLGDEWAKLNDYTYLNDPTKVNDSRWVHRSRARWESGENLDDSDMLGWRFFREMVRLIRLRKELIAFRNGGMEVLEVENPHVFAFLRRHGSARVVVLANFSEDPQIVSSRDFSEYSPDRRFHDVISEISVAADAGVHLGGYGFMWLVPGYSEMG